MNHRPHILYSLMLGISAVTASARDVAWESRLADVFSSRPEEIRLSINQIDRQLEALPQIRIEDLRGSGGYATVAAVPEPTEKTGSFAVEVRWPERHDIDLVALVPARNYNAAGLDIHYGLPLEFSVDLINEKGEVILHLADEHDAGRGPVRHGHPFVYQLEVPVSAAGARVTAHRLPAGLKPKESFIHAWAEIFAFEGEKNVAERSEVIVFPSKVHSDPWHWAPEFIVDGQTPLGLPERPGASVKGIGWLSSASNVAERVAWVQVDLGEEKSFNAVRLFPAQRPSFSSVPGFGIPQAMHVNVSESGKPATFVKIAELQEEMENPGDNPVTLRFPTHRARYVRVVATKFWKNFKNYHAFFGMSELQILNGETNIAAGCEVVCSSLPQKIAAHNDLFWSARSLTDGNGPEGELLTSRDWLLELSKRFDLEQARYQLSRELGRIHSRWRRGSLALLWTVGGFGTLGLVFLPIRYRVRVKRQVRKTTERIASDLHDEVGSNLATIGLLSGRKPSAGTMDDINSLCRETSLALREIIDITLASKRARKPFLDRLRDISSLMLCDHQSTFVGTESPVFDLDQRKNLVFFFKEAIHNIIRHADARHVRIAFENKPPDFHLVIEDDGRGFEVSPSDGSQNLHTLRQRARNLGGVLDVKSEIGSGTRLILTFPIKSRK